MSSSRADSAPKIKAEARWLTRLLPASMLWRSFLLIALLTLLAQAAWLLMFEEAQRERSAHHLAQMLTSMSNLTRVALLAARPEYRAAILADLSEREGVAVYPADNNDRYVSPSLPLEQRIEQLLRQSLGPQVKLAASLNGEKALFVRFEIFPGEAGSYWLALPRKRLERPFHWQWLAWGIAVLLLSLAGAWLIVFRISQPLKALEQAAEDIAAAQMVRPLREDGPREIRAVTHAFNHMTDQLRQAEENRAVLLAGISHDLRTPLTRLRMESELSVSDSAARAAIAADIEEMDRTIGQFLDFARPMGQISNQTLQPQQLLDEISSRYGRRVRRRNQGENLALRANADALRRAITNLLENALRHGQQQAASADLDEAYSAVELVCETTATETIIGVLDRGPGIALDQIERLKQPFARGERARSNTTGAGLGLSIVEHIARMHGGWLKLLPREQGGLAAYIHLPRLQ